METSVRYEEMDDKENRKLPPEVTKVLKENAPHRYRNIIHLWEFLLELLADERYTSIIAWSRKEEGEFKLRNAAEVAKRWGAFKNKSDMNYDKLSRAIRCYYRQGIIKKVPGQRLVYKFDKLPYEYKPRIEKLRLKLEKVANSLQEEKKSISELSFRSFQPAPSAIKSVHPPTLPEVQYLRDYQQRMYWLRCWFEIAQARATERDYCMLPHVNLPYYGEMEMSRFPSFLSYSMDTPQFLKSIPVSVIRSSC